MWKHYVPCDSTRHSDLVVDEDGGFIKAETNCDEVTHSPDAEDLFECSKCGAEVPAKYVYSE